MGVALTVRAVAVAEANSMGLGGAAVVVAATVWRAIHGMQAATLAMGKEVVVTGLRVWLVVVMAEAQ